VTGGLQGNLTVNGEVFNGVMPSWSLSDEEIANVLTFIYSSWENSRQEVTPDEVKQHRVTSTTNASE
jgi:nitrite reductase (NO-forming)